MNCAPKMPAASAPQGGAFGLGRPGAEPSSTGGASAGISAPPAPPAGVPLRVPVHPGRFLEKQYLVPLGITQTRLAELLGVSRRRVNELVMGHRAMSPDTAVRCALTFGTSAAFWLSLQANWDSYHAWRQLREQARAGAPLPPTVVAALDDPAMAHRVMRRDEPGHAPATSH
jgi:addiction module HigA family antidote